MSQATNSETREKAMSLLDEVGLAWAKRAERESENRVAQLQRKLSPLVKLRADEYEVDANLFDDEVQPLLRVGATIDGLTFCLDKEGTLCVVNWECPKKECRKVNRARVSDLASVGKAVALGHKMQIDKLDCGGHSRLGPRSVVA